MIGENSGSSEAFCTATMAVVRPWRTTMKRVRRYAVAAEEVRRGATPRRARRPTEDTATPR